MSEEVNFKYFEQCFLSFFQTPRGDWYALWQAEAAAGVYLLEGCQHTGVLQCSSWYGHWAASQGEKRQKEVKSIGRIVLSF